MRLYLDLLCLTFNLIQVNGHAMAIFNKNTEKNTYQFAVAVSLPSFLSISLSLFFSIFLSFSLFSSVFLARSQSPCFLFPIPLFLPIPFASDGSCTISHSLVPQWFALQPNKPIYIQKMPS